MKIYHLLAYRNDTGELVSQNEAIVSDWTEYRDYVKGKELEHIIWSIHEDVLNDSIRIAESFNHVTYQKQLIFSTDQLFLQL